MKLLLISGRATDLPSLEKDTNKAPEPLPHDSGTLLETNREFPSRTPELWLIA